MIRLAKDAIVFALMSAVLYVLGRFAPLPHQDAGGES